MQRVNDEGTSTAPVVQPSQNVLLISTARRRELQALDSTPVRLGSETEAIPVAGPDKVVKIGRLLPALVKTEFTILLREYADIFAWHPKDMRGIPPELMTHKLNISPFVKPVRQKKRIFAPDRNKAVRAKIV